MTREEYIKECFKSYITESFEPFARNNLGYINDLEDAFYEGVRCANNKPKNPWINVKDDLPCNHPEMLHPNYTDKVLVLSRHGYSEVAFMCLIGGAWEWNTFIEVLYWMPIPKLPKE